MLTLEAYQKWNSVFGFVGANAGLSCEGEIICIILLSTNTEVSVLGFKYVCFIFRSF